MTLSISEAEALGIPLDVGSVLEVRNLSTAVDGTVMEWRRIVVEEGRDEWKPFIVYPDGKEISPLWQALPGSQYTFLTCPVPEALLAGNRGPGKRIANDNLLLTDGGWKQVGQVTYEDKLVSVDGTYTKIKGIYPSNEGTLYRFIFDDGATLDADLDHLWSVRSGKARADDPWRVKSTAELLKSNQTWYIPTMTGPAPGERWNKFDPWLIGYVLGNGSVNGQNLTVYTDEECLKDQLESWGWRAYRYDYSTCWMVQACTSETRNVGKEIANFLGSGCVGDQKKVPHEMLMADPETRLALLQGLMDSDGSVDVPDTGRVDKKGYRVTGGRCEFKSVSLRLCKDVQYLVRSLGGKATIKRKERKERSRGTRDHIFKVQVMHCNKFNPFKLSRKSERVKKMKGVYRKICSIEKIENGPATCFEVDHPSHLFVCQDFVVTHNTVSLLMDYAKDVGKGWGKAWRGVLFRKSYGDLDDVVQKIEEHFPPMFPGFKFLKSKAEYSAVWPDGEQLLLRHMVDEHGYNDYHGHQYPWIGWEELTQWENDKAYKRMMSCNRPTRPGIPLRIRATTNPCVDEGEVMTPSGWKDIREMRLGDEVFSFDAQGKLRVSRVNAVYAHDYDGDLVRREGRGLYMSMTPNHRLPKIGGTRENRGNTRDPKGAKKFSLVPFEELPGQATIMRAVDDWEGEALPFFAVPTVETRKRKNPITTRMTGDQYAEFMGWWLSEGCVVERDNAFAIAQMKESHRERIRKLLDSIGFKCSWSDKGVTVYSREWYEHLKQFGLCRDKFVPDELKKASKKQLQLFFNAAVNGDGHWTGKYNGQYYTTSKQLADDMAEIAVKLGLVVYISSRQRENREGISYCVNFSNRKNISLCTGNHVYGADTNQERNDIVRVPHKGKVYCIGVEEDETFVIRQRGCVWLSGNSGIGHGWVKKRFNLPQGFGKVIRNPGEQPRVAIHSDLSENFILLHADPSYPNKVRDAAANPAEAEAWLKGSWEITTGGMFDDLWNARVHVIPSLPFRVIPSGWKITRSYDHGQAHPFAVLWWAESNGEPIEYQGNIYGNVRGDLFLLAEWYGCNGEENVGIRMPAVDIAEGIRDRQRDYGIDHRVIPGPADTEIYNKDSNRMGKSPADDMESKGVFWERADKTSGSRHRGFELVRSYLKQAVPHADGTRDRPGLFVCERCKWWIQLVPTAPKSDKDPDDVPEKYPDHLCDATRYRVSWQIPGMWRKSGF